MNSLLAACSTVCSTAFSGADCCYSITLATTTCSSTARLTQLLPCAHCSPSHSLYTHTHSITAATLVAQSTATAESTARGVQLPRFEAAEFQRTWKFILSYFWLDCLVCWLAYGLHRCLADWTFKWNMVLNTMLLVHAVGWWPEGKSAAHLYIVCMSLRVIVSAALLCCSASAPSTAEVLC
jgi:hypothetical protein